jgi:hypothetical protein
MAPIPPCFWEDDTWLSLNAHQQDIPVWTPGMAHEDGLSIKQVSAVPGLFDHKERLKKGARANLTGHSVAACEAAMLRATSTANPQGTRARDLAM